MAPVVQLADRGRSAASPRCSPASIALTQTDLKRVLAYSTVSQLGYMFMALGAGVGDVAAARGRRRRCSTCSPTPSSRPCSFLASGSVMHAMGGVIDMRRFGGLRHRMPIHLLDVRRRRPGALRGSPPFAGFFSKDEILLALKSASHAGSPGIGLAAGPTGWSTGSPS